MSNIFGTLNTGYSGLKSSQTAIDVTGHNVANASNDHYTRQRAVITNAVPLKTDPGDLGRGSQVSEIVRIHDEFVFQRYQSAANSQSNSGYKQDVFNTLNTYFPEIDEVGIHKDMQDYFNSWQALSNNPDDGAIKIDLATRTQTMTNSIQSTREKVEKLQTNINDDIEVAVNEINRLAEGIAELNEKISTHESGGINNANDLRDQRDKLEKALNEIVNTSVTKTNMSSKSEIDHNIHDYNDQYTLNVGGFNIVDGADFHPVSLDSDNNNSGYHEINFVRKDLKKFPMEDAIHGGRLGAMLDMRGREYDVSKKGFIDGELQDTLDGLDQLANSLIESTNNLYAQSPSQSMSSTADVEADYSLLNSDVHINEGSFMVNVYNNNGEVVSSKEVSIDSGTIFDGPGANTIVNKINSDTDDNGDSNSNNDIDDFLQATFKDGKLVFDMNDSAKFNGYTFNITEKDAKNPTNFAGAMGMNQFFEGSDARDIGLNINLQNRPSDIQAGTTPNSGDKALANDMQQLQFEKVNFYSRNSHEVQSQETLERFFTQVAGGAASRSADVDAMHDSNTALFNSVKSEYDSISKVSIDEELTNLIKFQTGYQAAAKVITTVDQMVNSLLQMR